MKKDGVMKSRRKFIKKLGGAALGAAAASAVPTIAGAAQGSATGWASTYDWVCVGSGVTGCTAAIIGHDKGLKTLMLEKLDVVGGAATAISGGVVWAPLNPFMKTAGITETREDALAYLEWIGGGLTTPEYRENYVDNAPRTIEYLSEKAEVKFYDPQLKEFYYPGAAGSKVRGRMLMPEPFPAKTLGGWQSKVRLAHFYYGFQDYLEEWGWEHNPSHSDSLKGAPKGEIIGNTGPVRGIETTALRLWRKRLGDPRVEHYMNSDEEHRVAGAALAAYLFRAVLKRGIEVRTETGVEKLLVENGRVVGVVVNHKGREENIRANKGILLGTGGGNGVGLAAEVGALLDTEAGLSGGFDFPAVPDERYPDGRLPDGYGANRGPNETRMRHGMLVNKFGERFGNEGRQFSIQERMRDFDQYGEHRFRNIPNYLIFDHQLIEKYSFAGRPPGETEGLEWVTQGRTIGELAQKLGLPPAKLETTVARFNQHARRREDPDFHRPSETLGTLEKPPFYGLKGTEPSDPFHSAINVVVNTHAQVLHYKTGKPIPGFYAGGALVESDKIYGVGYNAGMSLLFCAESALLAAEHAAGSTP